MRHKVFVVDYSVNGINSCGNILDHSFIPNPWTAIVVNNCIFPKLWLQSHSSNNWECCSHTVASGQDWGSWILFEQFTHSLIKFFLYEMIIFKEALMNPTIFAIVLDFFKVEILNPVSGISRSSERHNDLILLLLVTYICWSNSQQIVDMSDFPKINESFSSFTIPGLKAFLSTVWQDSIISILLGFLWDIRSWISEIRTENDCNDETEQDQSPMTFNHGRYFILRFWVIIVW